MRDERGEKAAAEPNYHLVDGAEQDYIDLVRADPELESQVKADLKYIGENPQEAGIGLNRVEAQANRTEDQLSSEQLARLKVSRLLRRGTYCIYWVIETTETDDTYPAIWRIELLTENENPAALPELWLETLRKVRNVFNDD